jgi:hypothetical protein
MKKVTKKLEKEITNEIGEISEMISEMDAIWGIWASISLAIFFVIFHSFTVGLQMAGIEIISLAGISLTIIVCFLFSSVHVKKHVRRIGV